MANNANSGKMTDGEFYAFQMIWTVVLMIGCAVIGCRDKSAKTAEENVAQDARAEKRYLVYRDELEAATNAVLESAVKKADVPSLGEDPTIGDVIDAVSSMGAE